MAKDRQDVRRRGRKIFAALRRHGEGQPEPPAVKDEPAEPHAEPEPAVGAETTIDLTHREAPADGRPGALEGDGPEEPEVRTEEPVAGATEAPAGEEEASEEAEEAADEGLEGPGSPERPGASRSRGMAPPPGRSGAPTAVSEPSAPSDMGPDVIASVTIAGEPNQLALPRVVAIANQKGGVGKTTTAVNLGAALAELDHRVLVVDLDPQGNATTGLGINARDLEHSIYDVITAETAIEDCIESTSLRNLFLVPATIDLSGAEIELVPAFSRELKLRRALESVKDDYDFTIIDCPPSLGLLTINGLAAADDVIVPIQCEYYALEGLGQLLRNVSLVRSSLNPGLEVRGIVLTMYDGRTRLAEQVEAEVRKHFGAVVYDTVIPRTVRLGEAPSFGQPIIVFDPTSRGATTYRSLAQEVSDGTAGRTG